MAIDGFHINGAALIYAQSSLGGALSLLGYTVDGADVEIVKNVSEIMTDIFGDKTPHDLQDMGEMGTFNLPIIASDRGVLQSIMNKGDKAAPGLLNTPGIPLGSAGYGFALGISSPADTPWYFFRCFIRPSARVKLGTKASPFTLSVLALPKADYTTVSGKNAPLYQRSFS